MTAEIGILNSMGIALAADSASTVRTEWNTKVFNSANKLFALSKQHPVGIMIFGAADFMFTPWETIVKMFRSQLGPEPFEKLSDYAENFFSFLCSDPRIISPGASEQHFLRVVSSFITNLGKLVADRLTESGKKFTRANVIEGFKEELEEWFKILDEAPYADGFNDDLCEKLSLEKYDTVTEVFKEIVVKRFKLDEAFFKQLSKTVSCLFMKTFSTPFSSGVVITGYGESEVFPSLYQYNIESMTYGKIKYKCVKTVNIGVGYEQEKSAILPFAQQEMAQSFMYGMDPSLKSDIDQSLRKVFWDFGDFVNESFKSVRSTVRLFDGEKDQFDTIGRNVLKEFSSGLQQAQEEQFYQPLKNVVSILPKEELAAMAEALINLTSLKRRVSLDSETVGGPIDVAVISKGDGFIWIKRKHYFQPELNPHFFKEGWQRNASD